MRFGDILIMETGKDGGPDSKVEGYWLVRIKSLFTVALLRFGEGSREAFHSHTFNSVSWLLSGGLIEHAIDGVHGRVTWHAPSLLPIFTRRDTLHRVYGIEASNWVLTFRGPWADAWKEIDEQGYHIVLTHNRVEVSREA